MNALARAEKLKHLRGLIDDVHTSGHTKEFFYFSRAGLSLPCGALVTISGVGKTTKAVEFLAEHSQSIAWIEDKLSIYPCAMLQKNVALNRVLFAEGGKHIFWTCLQILKSGLFKIVVICSSFYEAGILRKLQLAAEKAHTLVILLSEKPISSWTIALDIPIRRL